ncbi:diacylglycerol kinase family protein [Spirochaetia bacterium 38H-sp]|uniref:Diacylglycerol kinase family protein n=1 Tax=Rarispira pelagica TaxID=3141764 RepID=A0ABU9UB61_9SPIR
MGNRETQINRLVRLLQTALRASDFFLDYKVYSIINPASGTIARAGRLKRVLDNAEKSFIAVEKSKLKLAAHVSSDITEPVKLARMISQRSEENVLILSCGGDGTHNMVVNGIMQAEEKKRQNVVLMRVPLGSGNDAADAPDFLSALNKLATSNSIGKIPLYAMKGAKDRTFRYGCNIISFGIDAYISLVTNRVKPYLPGDTYKLIADMSTLFYHKIHPQAELGINLEKQITRDEYLLVAIGASGSRTYGNGKRILPDTNNICAVKNCSLADRLKLKKKIYAGEHIKETGVYSASARHITIDYDRLLPVQEDGEAWWLSKDDFPVEIKIISDVISVLA